MSIFKKRKYQKQIFLPKNDEMSYLNNTRDSGILLELSENKKDYLNQINPIWLGATKFDNKKSRSK